jgi:hypothetical protein
MLIAFLFATLAHVHTKFQTVPVSWPTSPLSKEEQRQMKMSSMPLGQAIPEMSILAPEGMHLPSFFRLHKIVILS